MKIIVNVIKGTCIFSAYGSGWSTVDSDKTYHDYKEYPFELALDGQDWHIGTIMELSDGNLLLFSSIGDEQPSSTMYVLKDWKIIQQEQEVNVVDVNTMDNLFDKKIKRKKNAPGGYGYVSGLPKKLKELLKIEEIVQK